MKMQEQLGMKDVNLLKKDENFMKAKNLAEKANILETKMPVLEAGKLARESKGDINVKLSRMFAGSGSSPQFNTNFFNRQQPKGNS